MLGRAPSYHVSGHRRVERAATVALPRLFWFSLLLQTRGPRHPHYKRRLCVLGRFGRGGWLFEASGFEATYQTRTCHPLHLQSPGRQSQSVATAVSLHAPA